MCSRPIKASRLGKGWGNEFLACSDEDRVFELANTQLVVFRDGSAFEGLRPLQTTATEQQ